MELDEEVTPPSPLEGFQLMENVLLDKSLKDSVWFWQNLSISGNF